jgi:hypothetical protein
MACPMQTFNRIRREVRLDLLVSTVCDIASEELRANVFKNENNVAILLSNSVVSKGALPAQVTAGQGDESNAVSWKISTESDLT